MDKTSDKSIRDFLHAVAANTAGFVAAWLFGSYAQKADNIYSDIDIAIVIENLDDSEKFNLQVQLMLLAAQFDTRIEPHPISLDDFSSGNPFIHEIKTTGTEIPIEF